MNDLINAIVALYGWDHGDETPWHAARWAYRTAGLITAAEYSAVLSEIPLP